MSDGRVIAADLRRAVDEGVGLFARMSEADSARRPADGKWSPREIIGHLIDSACNNHRRFIINQGDGDRLLVEPYEQNAWVSRNHYAETAAAELVSLWSAYNRHIARVLESVPADVLNRPRGPLHDFRFSYIEPTATSFATLGYLAEDYVAHLRHHLEQIRSLPA